jgi:hypothetical protein
MKPIYLIFIIVIESFMQIRPVPAQPIDHSKAWMQTTQREQVAFVAGLSHGLALMFTVLYKDNFPFIPSEFEGFTIRMETSKSEVEDAVVFSPRFILDTVKVAAAMTAIYNDRKNSYIPHIKVFVWACNIVEARTASQPMRKIKKSPLPKPGKRDIKR